MAEIESMKRLLILMPQHFLDEVRPMIIGRLSDLEVESIAVFDENVGAQKSALRKANFVLYTGVRITREMLEVANSWKLCRSGGRVLMELILMLLRS